MCSRSRKRCSKCSEAYHTILSGVPFSKHVPRLADIIGLECFSKLSKLWKVHFPQCGNVYLRSKTALNPSRETKFSGTHGDRGIFFSLFS